MKKNIVIGFYIFVLLIIGFIVYISFFNKNLFGKEKATIVSISQKEIGLKKGNSMQVFASVYPSNASGRRISFESDNESVVSINEVTGYAKGLKNGIATITVRLIDDNTVYDTCVIEVSDKTILPNDYMLETEVVNLSVGTKYQLMYQIKPSNANTYNLLFESTNNDIATINDHNEIVGKKEGETIIKMNDTISGNEKNILVKVGNTNIPKYNIDEDIQLKVNGSRQINNINANSYTWASLDNAIVTVTKDSIIKGIKEGETKIVVTNPQGESTYINVKVTNVDIKISELIIKEKVIESYVGEEKKINVIINPSNATNQKIIWSSSNPNVAKVVNGIVQALNVGETLITATSEDGLKKASVPFKVNTTNIIDEKDIEVEKLNYQINVGESINLNAKVLPSNATYKYLEYRSGNNNIVTVNDGLVLGKTKGETTIYITTYNKKIVKEIKVQVSDIEVEKILLNNKEKIISINEEYIIEPSIYPINASSKKLIFTSENNDIATVNVNGIVKGKKVGSTTITIKSNNGRTASFKIIVNNNEIPVEDISLNKTKETIYVGTTISLKSTLTPSLATNKMVTWTSSNNSVATVKDGVIKAIKEGETTITVTSNNGKKASCKITVTTNNIEVTSIKLNKQEVTIEKNDEIQLISTIKPSNATNKKITYTSSNNSVATVDSNGVIKGINEGTAIITVKTNNNKSSSCKVIVNAKKVEVTSVSLNKTNASIYIYGTLSLKASIVPSNAKDKTISWTSSNPSVATVNNSGVVSGKNIGTAIITATTSNGKSTSLSLTVNGPYLKSDTYPYIYEDGTAKLTIEKKTYLSPITGRQTVYHLAHLKITDYSRLHSGINNNNNSSDSSCGKTVYVYDTHTGANEIVGKNCGYVSVAASINGAIFAVEGDYSLNGGHGCNKIKGAIRDGRYFYVAGNGLDLSTIKASGIGYGFYSKKTGIMGPSSTLKSKNALLAVQSHEATDSFCFGTNLLVNGEISSSVLNSTAHRQANFVGYKGPGEFYFVVSEGAAYSDSDEPSDGVSYGLVPRDRAQLLKDLGCSYVAQLDGGISVIVWFNGKKLQAQSPKRPERDWLTDFVYFK